MPIPMAQFERDPTAAAGPAAASGPDARTRILYVATTRHSGGLEIASVRLAEMLMRAQPDRQEIVFACRPGKYIDEQCRALGIPTAPLTVVNSGDLTGASRLAAIAQDLRIDIIHVHSRRDYVTGLLAKALLQRRLGPGCAPALLLHMHLMRHLGSPVAVAGYVFAPLVDRFLAVSNAVREYLVRKHPQLSKESVVVVPNSVDVDKYILSSEQRASVRAKYGIADDAFVVGMVGRLDTKGQEAAIHAVGALRRPNVTLMLVGAAGKRGYADHLERLARRLTLDGRVIFCGPQTDIAPFLSSMDLFAHLPKDEAFGLAPAEAMAAGLPVLISNAGGCLELASGGRTALVANWRDPKDIQAKLAALIDDDTLRGRMARAGSAFVRARFTPEAQAQVMSAVYADVVADARQRT